MQPRAPLADATHWVSGRALALGTLLVVAAPGFVLAHDSVAEVEAQLHEQERYAELTNRAAPGFRLVDADGREVRLEDFRGKAVILNFLYSRCKEECPLHSVKLAEVQKQLSEASLGDRVQFVTIATDTEDAVATAESMRAHASRYGLDPASWVFLHGGPGHEDAGIRLAKTYGLEFVPASDGEQMHALVTHLIDPEGRLRARYHGLEFASVNLTLHAAVLVQGDDHDAEERMAGAGGLSSLKNYWFTLLIGLLSLGALIWMGRSFYRERWGRPHRHDSSGGTSVAPSADGKAP